MKELVFPPLNLRGFLLGLLGAHRLVAIRVFKVLEVFHELVVIGREMILPKFSQDSLKLAPRIDAARVDQLL